MMTRFGRSSLRRVHRFGAFGLFIVILLMGAITMLKLNVSTRLSNALLEHSINEMHFTMQLRIAAIQAAMPVNDYIIHADPGEVEAFHVLSEEVDRRFHELGARLEKGSPLKLGLEEARREWLRAQSVAEAIISIENPVGNQLAAVEMERFDQLIDNATSLLGDVYDAVYDQNMARSREIQAIEAHTGKIVGLLMLIGLALVVFANYWLPRAFFPPVHDVVRGMKALREGDTSARVATDVPIEFVSLATGFNAMAEEFEARAKTVKNS